MADTPALSPDQINSLLNTLNTMKGSVLVFLAVTGASIGLIYGTFRLLVMWLTMKAERRREESKSERAAEFRAQMSAMQETMTKTVEAIHQQMNSSRLAIVRSESVIDTLFAAVEATSKNVEVLLRLQQGAMRPEDSTLVMRWLFVYRLKMEVMATFEMSFDENHYDSRKTHIKRKVKTKLGDSIAGIMNEATRLKMVGDIGHYFPLYRVDGGVRFLLCDVIWDAAVPVYRRRESLDGSRMTPEQYAAAETALLKSQLEEMEVLVQNILEDHVARAEQQSKDAASERGGATGHRTPVPRPAEEPDRPPRTT